MSTESLFPTIHKFEEIEQAISELNEEQRSNFKFKNKNDEFIFCSYRQSVQANFPDPEELQQHNFTSKEAFEKERKKLQLLREVRGLVFDATTKTVVSRPFHKFFNLNESKETSIPTIAKIYSAAALTSSNLFQVLEKMDGQMIVPLLQRITGVTEASTDEKVTWYSLRFATKMDYESQSAEQVEKYIYASGSTKRDAHIEHHKKKIPWIAVRVQQNGEDSNTATTTTTEQQMLQQSIQLHDLGATIGQVEAPSITTDLSATSTDYIRFCVLWMLRRFTPVFEWTSPKSKIIIQYNVDSLNLLALRNNTHGYYIPFDQVNAEVHAEFPGIRTTKEIEMPLLEPGTTLESRLDQLYSFLMDKRDIEGAVIRFFDGRMYKVKTKWYYKLHKSKQHIQWNALSESHVWTLVLDNTLDDVLPVLDLEEDVKKLQDFANKCWYHIDLKVKQNIRLLVQFLKANEKSLGNVKELQKEFVRFAGTAISNKDEKSIVMKTWNDNASQLVMHFSTSASQLSESFMASLEEAVLDKYVKLLKIKANNKLLQEARELLSSNDLRYVPTKTFFGEREESLLTRKKQ